MPFVTANTDFSAEPALQALRNQGRIADSVVVTKGGQQIGIIGVTTPEVPNISSPGPTSSSRRRRRDRQRRGRSASPTRA